ncbi:MAG: RNase adapter RapZ [Pseudotabrizicola sp.]|uniref:RNase adapter RapZ n=1 Tax=Pseudotabrizicola sp. TaxID=2939647 RepID=UPI00271EC17B|nr:RNase adapter RapZ [Pseudotabrizicola sp.]MDO8883411.1 RNase adapter RapZ [Pseudotabrizicola sp.]MDP2082347.1 RNase adapter RapZ [Pseudotabrizicola sp.]MDZ7574326.1 RNase adapter RapZ [Pseudotabrizicola sp.]
MLDTVEDHTTLHRQDHQVVLVTGPSGAGRSTAVNALEDLGYEVIDNLPLSLVPRLVEGPVTSHPIALGLDVRNRDFAASSLIELIDRLTRDPRVNLTVLYLDCQPAVLVQRYSETRRRHPLAPSESPEQGIEREIDLLAPIKARADHLIDTTDLTVHGLKAEVTRWFGQGQGPTLAVSVQSFSYKRGVPRGVDMVFDCRFLRNPHWEPALQALNGRDSQVVDHIRTDPRFDEFILRMSELIAFLLPAHVAEGRSHVSIAFGCTGGQHRSVAVAELMADTLAQSGWAVSKRHRELERRAAADLAGTIHQATKADGV